MSSKVKDPVRRWGAVGFAAAILIAVIAPWMTRWTPLTIVVSVLLGVEIWALWEVSRTWKEHDR